jgi:outer membrane protein assembly factor BamB
MTPSPIVLGRIRSFCLLGLTGLGPVLGGNWPQYRGSQASGVDASAEAPLKWDVSSGTNVLWKAPVAGLGHAAPIVWGERVYTLTATKKGAAELKVGLYGDIDPVEDTEVHQWHLISLDRRTGKTVWDTMAHSAVPKVKRHTKSTHANSTPATDGHRIVAILGSEGLFCFDMSGALVWKKDLGPMDSGYYESKSAQWGFASSPILDSGRVYVQCDVQKGSFVAAYDAETGKELWKTPRNDVPTWGTPTLVDDSGRRQLVLNGWHHVGGYDPENGSELWKLEGGGDIPVPTPIFGHGLIFLTSAHGKLRPMRAVRTSASGTITGKEPGTTNAAIAWVHPRQGDYMQTPILVNGLLFGCLDLGLLTCFDASTGAIRYSERLSPSGRGWTASPVSDGRKLYFTSEEGEVAVVRASERFEPLAMNPLGETCLSTPALVDGTLYFRTRSQVIAVGAR